MTGLPFTFYCYLRTGECDIHGLMYSAGLLQPCNVAERQFNLHSTMFLRAIPRKQSTVAYT